MILAIKARPRKTVENFVGTPEGMLFELIDGNLVKRPTTNRTHQATVRDLSISLLNFVESQALGQVYYGPLDVHLPSGDIVEPDVIFIAEDHLDIIEDWIYGVPDLLVEVLTPECVVRDRIVKRDLYAKNGVREYWIVDPNERAIEVFSLRENLYEPDGYFDGDETLISPLLSGFQIRLSEVFTDFQPGSG